GWYHSENPAPLIKMLRHRPITIVRTISDKEIELLTPIFVKFNQAFGLFFQLGIHTGMRRTEIANLLWADVDLDHIPRAIAFVRPHAEDKEKGIVRSTVKTRRSERIVPLKTELINYLRPHCKTSGYVVDSDKYKICREQFDLPKKLLKQVREVCPQFHLHLMRHTFITNALMGGKKKDGKKQEPIPSVKVAMWVGDSVQMILDTYTHYIPDDSIDSF
ncbi:MAG: tyrosine-type recombinase/integrase, partial [Candidatus Hydrogenedentes bacterium]|nr:tyrosine-type recombinase/integrase [Candidatus Hydrogenedentota bacterium]